MNGLAQTVLAHVQAKGAGRICPRDYIYEPSVLARPADFVVDTLYAVGGLYGNTEALKTVNRLAAIEGATLVFNGDFHWFDAEKQWFAEIERAVAPHRALRGNVETEISRVDDIGAGCGCAYPERVTEAVVRRSNTILARLRALAPGAARTRMRILPMHLVIQIGGLRVAVVHGDARSLAGWHFAREGLDDPGGRSWLEDVRAASNIDIFACTHTCDAALRDFRLPSGRMTVINNGAAGMPNFKGMRFGVITRIAVTPSPHRTLYGVRRDGIHIDARAIDYDHEAFVARFLQSWPAGSPAYDSYYRRIVDGPDATLAQAAPR